ncbi:uncharacterized protein LOC116123206 [Pistacia vera]|uniref:uncharacterized protein LOC116123206 n=1 Tax=Pistacia vera TaxID=55513 RepID=UPI0012631943|nr:uncharacterized protein LOC116123206 [Pistacia vera]
MGGRLEPLHLQISRQMPPLLPCSQEVREVRVDPFLRRSLVATEKVLDLPSPPLLSKPMDEEKLYSYPTVLKIAILAVLVREEETKQLPVYYVSKSLLDAETRYSQLEKLAFALIHASRRLRPYFQCHPIVWTVELSKFDISYQPRTAVKSQALADFVADFTPSTTTQAERELLCMNSAPPSKWTLLVDGSSNVNGSGLGIVLIAPEGDIVQRAIRCGFKCTNNKAEYEALIAGLSLAREIGAKRLEVKSNSQLVVNQLQEEAQTVLAELHDGEYGNHAGGRSLAHRVITAGYYWSTIRTDSTAYVKKCDNCQRFGIPKKIVTDNGSQFISLGFKNFCDMWGIKLSFSTPRNPQSNSQAESLNKTIIHTLKKRLQKAKGAWVDELPGVLWSHRTTARSSTGETLFSLTYGSEAVIPVEVSVPSTRLQWADEESNSHNLCQNLDTVDKLHERVSIRNIVYQQQATRHYNRNVRIRTFKIGDWVLRRVFQNTKEINYDKLGPT